MKTDRLNYYRQLARQGNKNAQRVCDAFDPDQPREADGKWGSGGSGKGGSPVGHEERARSEAALAPSHAAVKTAQEHLSKNGNDPKAWRQAAAVLHAHADLIEQHGQGAMAAAHREDARSYEAHAARLEARQR